MILQDLLEAKSKLSAGQRKAFAKQINRLILDTGKVESSKVNGAIKLLKGARGEIMDRVVKLRKGTFTRSAALDLKSEIERQMRSFEIEAQAFMGDAEKEFAQIGLDYTKALGKAQGGSPRQLSISRDLILNATDRSADLITSLSNSQIDRANDIINRAVISGRSAFEVAQDLSAEFDKGLARMEAIARTEMLGIYSQAQMSQLDDMAQTNPGLKKQWVAVQDKRTRLGHLEAHLQSVAVDQPFEIHRTIRSKKGGEVLGPADEMMFPRDPSAEADQIVNCRCTLVSDFSDIKEQPSLSSEELPPVYSPIEGLGDQASAEFGKSELI